MGSIAAYSGKIYGVVGRCGFDNMVITVTNNLSKRENVT
jgi:hypothetical protein